MYLVTGGAGFIGSNLVHGLSKRGFHDIVVCDWMGHEDKWKNIAGAEIYSIITPEEIFTFLTQNATRIKAIFHMGAISTTTEKNVDAIVTNNFRLSQSLWLWCSVHKKPIIYASSAATYGASMEFEDDETIEHLAQLKPLNPYGWSKHIFDRWVARMKASGAEQPSQSVGLKFFNVYGPHEYHKGAQQSVAVHLFHQIQRNNEANLFKSYNPQFPHGGQIRDFIHVDDCVNVMMWLYDNPHISGLFNVGSGMGRTFNDLAHGVFQAMGRTPHINYVDMPEGLAAQYQYYTEANMNKLKSAGYTAPFYTLEEGVKQYVQEYLLKDDRYKGH